MGPLSSWGFEGTRNRLSSCVALLVHELGAQDRCRALLWMTTFWTGIVCPSGTSRRRSTMPWVHKDESQRFPPSWCASIDVWSSDIWTRIGGNRSRRDQSHVNTRHKVFRLVRALVWSNSPTPSIDVLCYWDWLFSISFGIFPGSLGDVFSLFSACPRCGSIISIYSQGIAS
jgi:hypothetical protein